MSFEWEEGRLEEARVSRKCWFFQWFSRFFEGEGGRLEEAGVSEMLVFHSFFLVFRGGGKAGSRKCRFFIGCLCFSRVWREGWRRPGFRKC